MIAHYVLVKGPFSIVVLKQKRYTWRHDSVLATLEVSLTQLLKGHNETSAKESKGNIHFVRPGESVATAKKKPRKSWLSGANDWQWLFDYDHQQYVFPVCVKWVASFAAISLRFRRGESKRA